MITKIFNSKNEYKKNIKKIQKKITIYNKKYSISPHLTIITLDNLFSTNLYVKNKIKACIKTKTKFTIFKLSKNVYNKSLIKIIKILNNDNKINGILVQLPLPKNIKKEHILSSIDLIKDVDILNPKNFGQYMMDYKKNIMPCITQSINIFFKKIKIKTKGLKVCIIGFSNIVGKPISYFLSKKGMTTTIINKNETNIMQILKKNDIFIIAIGIKKYISCKNISFGSIIIDIGINKSKNKKTLGDITIDKNIKKISYITAVPNGIGLLTTLGLIINNLLLYLKQQKRKKGELNGWSQ